MIRTASKECYVNAHVAQVPARAGARHKCLLLVVYCKLATHMLMYCLDTFLSMCMTKPVQACHGNMLPEDLYCCYVVCGNCGR